MPITRDEAFGNRNLLCDQLYQFLLTNSKMAFNVEELKKELQMEDAIIYFCIVILAQETRINTTIKNGRIYVWSVQRQ